MLRLKRGWVTSRGSRRLSVHSLPLAQVRFGAGGEGRCPMPSKFSTWCTLREVLGALLKDRVNSAREGPRHFSSTSWSD